MNDDIIKDITKDITKDVTKVVKTNILMGVAAAFICGSITWSALLLACTYLWNWIGFCSVIGTTLFAALCTLCVKDDE